MKNTNKIYLNDALEEEINSVNKELRDAWITFKYATYEKEKKIEKWKEAWDKVKEEVPVINKEIRKEFRKILGIK